MAKAQTNQKVSGKARSSSPKANPSYRACYERFLPEALALPDGEIEHCRADVRIAFANVKQGVEAACSDPARIRKAMPELRRGVEFEGLQAELERLRREVKGLELRAEAAEAQAALYQGVFEHLPVPAALYRADGVLSDINRRNRDGGR